MGFDSDVALVLSKDAVHKLHALMDKTILSQDSLSHIRGLLDTDYYHAVSADTGAEAWYWKDIKWAGYYESEEHIRFLDDFIASLKDEEFRIVCVDECKKVHYDKGTLKDFNVYISYNPEVCAYDVKTACM